MGHHWMISMCHDMQSMSIIWWRNEIMWNISGTLPREKVMEKIKFQYGESDCCLCKGNCRNPTEEFGHCQHGNL